MRSYADNNYPANHKPDWKIIAGLWPYLAEYRGRVILALSLLIMAKIATVSTPIALKYIVDYLDQNRGADMLLWMPLMLVLAEAASAMLAETGPDVWVHAPTPMVAVLAAMVASPGNEQMDWSAPASATVGCGVMLTLRSADVGSQGGLVMVQRSTTGPAPPVCVKVALGLLTEEKVPVPPLITDHAPEPATGVLAPNAAEVAPSQMVCGPPTLASGYTFTVVLAEAEQASRFVAVTV